MIAGAAMGRGQGMAWRYFCLGSCILDPDVLYVKCFIPRMNVELRLKDGRWIGGWMRRKFSVPGALCPRAAARVLVSPTFWPIPGANVDNWERSVP